MSWASTASEIRAVNPMDNCASNITVSKTSRRNSKAKSTPKLAQETGVPQVKGKKSRNGCITCKQRRLKCDETHPSCTNCTSKGKVCGGYNVAFKWKSFDQNIQISQPMQKQDSASSQTSSIQSSRSRKMSTTSLSSFGSNTIQKALEEATYSVTGKSYEEIAIANSLISYGKNPELAPAIAEILRNRQAGAEGQVNQDHNETEKGAVGIEGSNDIHVKQEKATTDTKENYNSLETLATAVVESIDQHPEFAAPSPGFFSQSGISSVADHESLLHHIGSPNMSTPGNAMSPNLQALLNGLEAGGVGSPNFSYSTGTHKLDSTGAPSPMPMTQKAISKHVAPSPKSSAVMKNFTNFFDSPSIGAPSPGNLDNSSNFGVTSNKRRQSVDVPQFYHESSKKMKRSNSDSTTPVSPGTFLVVDRSVTSSAVGSPDDSTSIEEALSLTVTLPKQIELNDEKFKMLGGFEKYTSGLMSMIAGGENPWINEMIPLAQEHNVLFNVFSAMTCFHLARGDSQLRSQGVKYMKNTVVDLAHGLSSGSMPPEIAMITCLCLQNSETWDRQTSTGIAHLKGAKSMLLEILKNLQKGEKLLLDQKTSGSTTTRFENVDDERDTKEKIQELENYKMSSNGLLLDESGLAVIPGKGSKNLALLFNAFVYFDVLARLTAESNDEMYDDVAKRSTTHSDSPQGFDDERNRASTCSTDGIDNLSDTEKSDPSNHTKRAGSSDVFGGLFGDLHKSVSLEGKQLDPLLGCAQSLFPIIGKTADLIRKAEKQKKNSLSIVSAAVEVKHELEQWKPPPVFELPKEQDQELMSCISTAEAYRYAILALLHQAVPEVPSKSSHELSEIVLMLLASIPNSSRTCITHIFPLLVASCEATPGEERDWVLQKWDALIKRMWIGNLDRSLEVVKECWIRRELKAKNNKSKAKEGDNVENLMSRIAGYVASARGEDANEEDDLSITGVKSWCHWRTIMKEWKWEVFLG